MPAKPYSTAELALREEKRLLRVRRATAAFDDLPGSGRLRIPVVLALTADSRSAFYARSAAGLAPPILKLAGGYASGVSVAEVRKYLAAPDSYRAPAMEAGS